MNDWAYAMSPEVSQVVAMPGSNVNNRRYVRHPVRIDAHILNWAVDDNACVIENFCSRGMGISVPGGGLGSRSLDEWLASGAALSIGFKLPGDGRQVRADASVRHARRDGNAIRIGLWFEHGNPKVLDALLREVLRMSEAPAASVRDAGSMMAAPEATSSLDEELVDVLDRFFVDVRDRLFARYQGDAANAADYFYGIVAVQGYERRIRESLTDAKNKSPDGLMSLFSKLVRELDVSPPVREMILATFEGLLRHGGAGLARRH